MTAASVPAQRSGFRAAGTERPSAMPPATPNSQPASAAPWASLDSSRLNHVAAASEPPTQRSWINFRTCSALMTCDADYADLARKLQLLAYPRDVEDHPVALERQLDDGSLRPFVRRGSAGGRRE